MVSVKIDKLNVGVVTTTIYAENHRVFLDNLIQVLRSICDEVFVITGNFPCRYDDRVHITEVESNKSRTGKESLARRAAQTLVSQLKVTFKLIELSRNFNIVLFHSGELLNFMPLLCAKLLKKRVVIFHLGGDKVKEMSARKISPVEKRILCLGWLIFIRAGYSLADVIACESESIVSFANLDRYRHKVAVPIGRYLDTGQFTITADLSERPNVVGYVGRFSAEKGVLNFVTAVPLILKEVDSLGFSLVGDGPLRQQVETEIEKNGLANKVALSRWITHDKLPDYLNQLKFLVLPSSSEGIPGIVQEAMACGSIVVATPVGGIPDLIIDGETGFIIEDNNAEAIAQGVIRALKYPDLNRVARKARAFIEKEYGYEAVVGRYREMLQKVRGSNEN